MKAMGRTLLSSLAAVGAGFASALCCVGPVLYVTVGIGAGLAGTFEPLRPWFLGAAVLFLALGFYGVHARSPEACVADGECETLEEARKRRTRQKAMLWASTALVALFVTFPAWSNWLT